MDKVTRKTALRLLTYGLYVVAVRNGHDQNVFTANWLTQVSFNPPMLALSVENESHSIELIRASRIFTINILASGDRALAGLLGKRWANVPNKLARVAHRTGPNGCAVLEAALAYFDCNVLGAVAAGDSTVFIAELVDARVLRDGAPLTMAEAGFRHAG